MDYHANRNALATVTQTITLLLIDSEGGASPLETEFSYDPREPFAVSTTFRTATGQVRWTFARDLLIDGLSEPTGDGDVHAWPCLGGNGHAVIILELSAPDGEALVQAPSADVTTFVERTKDVISPGSESAQLDVEAWIAEIFDDAEAA